MPREAREKSPTGIYHIIMRGINRQSIFEDEEDITPTYFEEIEKEDASLSQRLAYNQENQQIDIVDKKPKIEIEEMKE